MSETGYRIPISFRFDDPSPIGDHILERHIFDIFSRHHVPLCVAVIPFTQSKEKLIRLSKENARHLISAQKDDVIDIVLHGHSHIARSKTMEGKPSEFAGIQESDQRGMIDEGLELLQSIFDTEIKGFVPPWNTYDVGTLRILERNGIEYLSAGGRPFRNTSIPEIPRSCTLQNCREAIREAIEYRSFQPVVVINFHPDDFGEFKWPPDPDEPPPHTDLPELEETLRWIHSLDELEPVPLRNLARSAHHRRLWSIDENRHLKRLPYRIKRQFPRRILISTPPLLTTIRIVLKAIVRSFK